jgi:diacylglycerol kinase family enzyme
METFQARHVEISCDREQPRELDGDLIEPSRTLTAAARPAALWLCVPEPQSAGTVAHSERATALAAPRA